MAYRKILVPVVGTPAGRAALSVAFQIARIWRAHVHGLHVRLDPRDVAPLAGEGLSGAMIEEMMAATERESGTRASAAEALFRSFVAENGIHLAADPETAFRAGGLTASFASGIGRDDETVAHEARLADITVIAHPEADEDVSTSDALHAVLFDSGRPIVIAPKVAPASIGTRIAIGWNGSSESAAAIAAGLPWFERAEAVAVLTSDEYHRRGPEAAELLAYLAWHNVRPEVRSFKGIGNVVGAGLLKAAGDFQADLLVMGAYSHSRLRQLILGGVTRHVLANSEIPLMLNR